MIPEYRPLQKADYQLIKVGDVVERMLAFLKPMYLNVTNVTENIISCGAWDFDRETGLEIDEDISVPVSYISRVLTEEEKKKIKKEGKL